MSIVTQQYTGAGCPLLNWQENSLLSYAHWFVVSFLMCADLSRMSLSPPGMWKEHGVQDFALRMEGRTILTTTWWRVLWWLLILICSFVMLSYHTRGPLQPLLKTIETLTLISIRTGSDPWGGEYFFNRKRRNAMFYVTQQLQFIWNFSSSALKG